MTAIARYAKLEAEARYFDGRSARPTEVVISFGERSLVIMGAGDQPLAHWPLASLRALNDRGDASVQLAPAPDSDERIVLDDARMIGAIRKVCADLYRRPVDRRGIGRAVFWSGGAIAAVVLVIFVVIPGLANQLALLIPPAREVALGDAVTDQVRDLLALIDGEEEPPGFCSDPEGLAAIDRMVGRVYPGGEMPYPLRVSTLDHGLENAVALPGGRVLLFRGLIEAAESPEEVAAILAHEIGHVIHRDPTRGVLRSAGTAGIFGLLLGDVFGASVVVAASEAVLNASYQREAETRADETAYRLMAEADLPLAPFARFFERLAEQRGGGSNSALRYLASHPGLVGRAERAVAADRIGGRPFEPVLKDRGWVAMQGICSETAGEVE